MSTLTLNTFETRFWKNKCAYCPLTIYTFMYILVYCLVLISLQAIEHLLLNHYFTTELTIQIVVDRTRALCKQRLVLVHCAELALTVMYELQTFRYYNNNTNFPKYLRRIKK